MRPAPDDPRAAIDANEDRPSAFERDLAVDPTDALEVERVGQAGQDALTWIETIALLRTPP